MTTNRDNSEPASSDVEANGMLHRSLWSANEDELAERPAVDKSWEVLSLVQSVPPANPLEKKVGSREESQPSDLEVDELDKLLSQGFGRPATESGVPAAREGGTFQRYGQQNFLARGGMGSIYEVVDQNLNRVVAMKVLTPLPLTSESTQASRDPHLVARFLNEAQITAQLDHPGIVPVYELGFGDQSEAYFTMKLVKGLDLQSLLSQFREVPADWNLPRLIGVLVKVCHAIAYAHSKGVVHRDLKPANIMVGRFGEVYVMDWGLMRVVGQQDLRDLRFCEDAAGETIDTTVDQYQPDQCQPDQCQPDQCQTTGELEPEASTPSPLLTMDGAVLGTPAYMSPEQAQGRLEEVDSCSDVYSLGAVLYEMLASQPPYFDPETTHTPRAVLEAVRLGPPRPIRELNRRAPQELVAICEKAMARDRGARYESCFDMAEDLQAFLDRRVVRAYQTGAMAELRYWFARNRLAASVATISAVLLVGLMALFLGYQWKANQTIADKNRLLERNLYDASVAAANRTYEDALWFETESHLQSSPEALRSWEWDFLNARLHRSEPIKLALSETAMSCAVFEPESDNLLACGRSGPVLRISYPGGLQVGSLPSAAALAELRPATRQVVLASKSGVLELYELHNEPELLWRVQAHEAEIDGLAVSPNGKLIATGAFDKTICLWNAETGARLGTLEGHGEKIRGLAFHPDGKILACGTHFMHSAKVTLWDVESGQLLRRLEVEHDALAFSPDKRVLATAGQDCKIRIWDVASGTELWRMDHGVPVRTISFSPDGTLLLCGGVEGKLVLRRMASRSVAHSLGGIDSTIWQARFDAAGERIVAAGDDGQIYMYALPRDCMELRGHAGEIWHGDFHPNGREVATAGFADGSIKLWDGDTGEELRTFQGHTNNVVWSVRFSPDGKTLLSAGQDGTLRTWDVASGRPLQVLDGLLGKAPNRTTDRVVVADFGFEPSEVVSGNIFGDLCFWDLTSGTIRKQVQLRYGCWALDVASMKGLILAPLAEGSVDILDRVGQPFGPPLRKHWRTAHCAAFSGDETMLASGSVDGSVIVRDTRTGAELQMLRPNTDTVWSVAFSPDGQRITTSSESGAIRLWDIASGMEMCTIAKLGSRVAHIQFSPEGKRLLSCGQDGIARIWETEDPAPQLKLVRQEVRAAVRFLEFAQQSASLQQLQQRLAQDTCDLTPGVHRFATRIVASRLGAPTDASN